MSSRQYTIRSVPAHVDQALRRMAKKQGRSLNALVVEILEGATTAGAEPKERHDLDEFIGTWVEDAAFDEAIRDFECVDEEMWK